MNLTTRLASFALLLATTLTSAQTTRPVPALKMGDPAPAFTAGAFAQGNPISQLEKGHVYVIEFWATWCGPCVEAMPHLSKLSDQYKGKVTFIGMDASERKANNGAPIDPLATVNSFLQRSPGRMTYNVAVDNPNGDMMTNWLHAANLSGIPATFVIDQKGKIAWIGHPAQLETPLAQILAGTFDPKKFSADNDIEATTYKALQDTARAHDYPGVLTQIAALENDNPTLAAKLAPKLASLRFACLLKTNEPQALPLLQTAVDNKDADLITSYAQAIAATAKMSPATCAAGAAAFESIVQPGSPDKSAPDFMTISRLYLSANNLPKALENAQKALADGKATNASPRYIEIIETHIATLNAHLNANHP